MAYRFSLFKCANANAFQSIPFLWMCNRPLQMYTLWKIAISYRSNWSGYRWNSTWKPRFCFLYHRKHTHTNYTTLHCMALQWSEILLQSHLNAIKKVDWLRVGHTVHLCGRIKTKIKKINTLTLRRETKMVKIGVQWRATLPRSCRCLIHTEVVVSLVA